MHAAGRIRSYHERQLSQSWSFTDDDGTQLGQQVTPLDRVGIYVPGGKAAYPSSVLMNAIPARVAGVPRDRHGDPDAGGERNDLVLAAAALCGVNRVFAIGGAQAVGALAYGTRTVPKVDKIVGPGNAYVAAAKRRVFGTVGIDMIAGPVGDPGAVRRHNQRRLGGHGPVLAGRARRDGPGDPAVPGRRPSCARWATASSGCCPTCRGAT